MLDRTQISQLSPERLELITRMIQEKKGRPAEVRPLEAWPRLESEVHVLPVSFAQERLWFLDAFDPGLIAYNEPSLTWIRGPLRERELALALGEVITRHETLRTTFRLEQGAPVQVVVPSLAPPTLPQVDLRHLSAALREAEARRSAVMVARRRFDLARGPLLRAVLFRLADDEHLLLLVFHHIVADGWSYYVMLRELAFAYGALATGSPPVWPALPIQYGDFARWQREQLRSELFARQLAYWRERLAGLPEVLPLPTDRPRPERSRHRGGQVPLIFPQTLYNNLQQRAQAEGVTVFLLLLAAYQLLLRLYSGAEDVAVGMPVAARNRTELEGLVGFFVNPLVLRGDFPGDPPLLDLLAGLRKVTLEALGHQDLPFDRLIQELRIERSLSHTPLFQVTLAFQSALPGTFEVPGLALKREGIDAGTSKFDLNLNLQELDGDLSGWLEYDTDLFDPVTAVRMAGHLSALLASVATADRSIPASDLPMLREEERHQLVVESGFVDLPRGPSLNELFAMQVLARPEAVALTCDGENLTYGELRGRAARLAAWLRRLGVGPEVRVGLCVERSPAMVVGILGILEAGGAYVPLDPAYPESRLRFLLEDSGVRILLTQRSVRADLRELTETILDLDEADEHGEDGAAVSPSGVEPENLAYVIYTSGSTGRPKGVGVSHANVVRLLASTSGRFGFSGDDVWTLFHSYAFDFSVWEIWGALAYGARLVVVPYWVSRSPQALHDLLVQERVTVLNQTPSAFLLLAQADRDNAGELALRWVIFGGEALDPRSLRSWTARHGDEKPALVNMYGITETTVHVTWRRLRCEDVGSAASLLGAPLSDLSVHLLDRRFQPVPSGVTGEIWVGGSGVARGYLGRPELTAQRFLPDPFGGLPGGRLYRSGDLARRRRSGELEYQGRMDHQVKVRGYRIEVGEIEAALALHPAVARALVLARPGPAGDVQLVAYLTATAELPSAKELRAFLREHLPEPMLPAAFVGVDAFPLTAHGKIDRAALPAPDFGRQGTGVFVAPRTPLEELLAGVWADVLGLQQVGVEEDFFALGGHSLATVRVASRVREICGVDLPLRRLFELPTLALLAAEVESRREREAERGIPPLRRVPREAGIPLSFSQQRVWFLDRLEPGSAVFNLATAVHLEGDLHVPALAAGLDEIVRRQEALRSRFLEAGGEPSLVVEPPTPRPLALVDLSGLGEPLRQAEKERLVREEARRPFNLADGPLLRTALLRLAPGEHLAVLTLHHIVADGWSLWVFTREMSAAYEAFAAGRRPELPELPVQFADYAAWQRGWLQGETLARELAFWKEQLAGAPEALSLPFDRPRGAVQRYRGGRRSFVLPPELTERLRALGRAVGATLFMTLLTAWSALLWRYSNQSDLSTGTVVANRQRRELENLIGFFINTLVLRLRLGEDLTFRQAIAQAREVTLDVYAHQDMPFERLVEELNPERDLSLTPLFQVMLILQNTPAADLTLPGLRLSVREIERDTVNYDLLFTLEEHGGGLTGVLSYDADLFDGATAGRLLAHFHALLQRMADEPDRRLPGPPLLSDAERHHLLTEWNDTGRGSSSPAATFSEMFEEQARRRPEACAAVCGGERISYGDLAAQVDRMARSLHRHGVGVDSIVPVLDDRGLPFLAVVLAIQRCGAAYLPLDPKHPERRIGQILASSRAPLLVVSRAYQERVTAALEALPPGDRPQVALLEELAELPHEGVEPPRGLPESLAYVIFTSGSTGQPKGVMVESRGLLNNVRSKIEDLPLTERDTVAQTASQCFDISVWQFLAVLAVGGVVRIVPDQVAHDPGSLLAELERGGVTVLEIVPSLLQAVLDEVDRLGPARPLLQELRWVMPTGEAVPAGLCRRWLAAYPAVPLLNLYGPSECSDDVSALAITEGWEAGDAITPIGRPLRNIRLHILDPRLNPVPVGVVGELFIGGLCLGRGYLFDPARTASSFLADRLSGEPGARLYRTGDFARYLADGRIEFLGRADHQVKVRGFRIEVGEIEAVLRQHPEVGQAVVTARKGNASAGAVHLAAYVTPPAQTSGLEDWGNAESVARLRSFLAERLPDYMVPTYFVCLESLPLSPNGKIDRRALPAPDLSRQGRVSTPARTRAEKAVAGIWKEVLGVEQVGLEDSFFELGGHSLLATQVLSRLRAELDVDLPLRQLFEARNLESLARQVEAAQGEDAEPFTLAIPPAPAAEAEHLSFAQERLWFLDQLEPGSPAYNLPNAVHLAGTLVPGALARALGEIVRRHDSLRMTFRSVAGQPRQTVLPAVCLEVPELDLSALPSAAAQAETVHLARLDARHPFDLERGPLLRVLLLRRGLADHVLLVNLHHIVSDGWSMGILLEEVAALYPAFAAGHPSPLPALPIQYPDYAAWQRRLLQGELLERQLAYWKEQLAGAPGPLDLPRLGAGPASLRPGQGGTRRFRVSAPLGAQLRTLSRQQETTLFMTLLAGFAALLRRYSGAGDLMIGVPVAGRSRPELERLIGFFVNTLVLRVRLDGSTTGAELLQHVRRASLDALTHQDVPFEKLVAELNPERDLDRSTLFQVMFALQNAPAARIDLPQMSLGRLEIDTGTVRFELYLEMTEDGDEIGGVLQYSLDLFEAPFIARLAGHFLSLLEGMARGPGRWVDTISVLSEAEQTQLVREWNDTDCEVRLDAPFQTLFEESVARHPDRVAAACDGYSWTYAQLDRRANAVARRLGEQGLQAEGVVALLAERSLEFLAALLGVFKAGGAYLPLDPHHPVSRIRQCLEQSRASLVVTADALQPLLSEALSGSTQGARPAVLTLEALAGEDESAGPPCGGVEQMAYVIFTSGSTGVPKGAMLVHRGMINHLFANIIELGLTAADVMAQTASQCFDISVWQFLAPLVVGGRVEIYRDEVVHDPALLLDRVESDGVTVLEAVPSLMRLMMEEVRRRQGSGPSLGGLRWLLPTGEALLPDLCREWYRAYPHAVLLNAYGPTECSDDVSFYRVPLLDPGRTVPIGRPVLNTRLYVLDGGLHLAPLGVAGELYVGGSGVGRGYLLAPEKTAASFIPDPFSEGRGERLYRTGDVARLRAEGQIEFLGRIDHQVKIRGFRLELGEIEAALGEHPDVESCVALARPEASGSHRLVAYMVARPPAALSVEDLRNRLRARLPEYAIPSSWVMLDRLPLNPNGKVDRGALPEPEMAGSTERIYVEPRTEGELAVAEIFAAILGLERVGAFDDFFDLGGHSLLATQTVWRLRERFAVDLSLRALFEAPTVAELAGMIEERILEEIESLSEESVDALLESDPDAVEPPTIEEHYS